MRLLSKVYENCLFVLNVADSLLMKMLFILMYGEEPWIKKYLQ